MEIHHYTIACSSHDYELLEYLLTAQSCRADIPNKSGNLALHTIIKAEFTCSANSKTHYSYLAKESKVQLLKVMEMLVGRNSEATMTENNDGVTPTHMAIPSGEIELLEIFFKTTELNLDAKNAFLHIAYKHGRSQMVRWFIDHGINSNVVNDIDCGDFHQHSCFGNENPCSKKLDFCQQYKYGDTTLHLACQEESDSDLLYILESTNNCADAFVIQNNEGDTPLHKLAIHNKIWSIWEHSSTCCMSA